MKNFTSKSQKIGELGEEVARFHQAALEALHQTGRGDPLANARGGVWAMLRQGQERPAEIEMHQNPAKIEDDGFMHCH